MNLNCPFTYVSLFSKVIRYIKEDVELIVNTWKFTVGAQMSISNGNFEERE